jgi:hypothetical protein
VVLSGGRARGRGRPKGRTGTRRLSLTAATTYRRHRSLPAPGRCPRGAGWSMKATGERGGLDSPGEQQDCDHHGSYCNEEEVHSQLRSLRGHLDPGVKQKRDGHDHGNDSREVVLIHGGQVSHGYLAYSAAVVLSGLAGEWGSGGRGRGEVRLGSEEGLRRKPQMCLRYGPIGHRNVDFFAPGSLMPTFRAQIGHRHENLAARAQKSASVGQDLSSESTARRRLSVARSEQCHAEGQRARPEALGDRASLVKRSICCFRLPAGREVAGIIG